MRKRSILQSSEPHVGILIDSATGWGRRVIQGIIHYSKINGPWHLWIRPKGQDERILLPHGWTGDGIIARVSSEKIAEHLRGRGAVVNISSIRLAKEEFVRVQSDIRASIVLAVEHFLDRGQRCFGYCSFTERSYVAYHSELYRTEVEKRGFPCHVFKRSRGWRRSDWQTRQRALQDWLSELPKPIGILTWATIAGVDVINACRDARIKVPDEISVLGGDYDDLICEACQPPLSGLAVPSEQIGFEAARILDEMIQGKKPRENETLIQPTGVISRLSSDVIAVDDEDLVAAIRFIRNNAHQPIRVDDVVYEVAVSRRSLERRFKSMLGRTMLEEIARVHLEQSKLLLATTELSIPQVAAASGYRTPEYFVTRFRQTLDVTPLKYRQALRGRLAEQNDG